MFTLLAGLLSPLLVRALPSATIYNPGLKLTTPISCGDSQTFSDVIVDTGSCLLWVGGEDEWYIPGPDSVATGQSFGAGYGSGFATGYVYFDTVAVGSAVATHQVIGAANTSQISPPAGPSVNGIFGLGPDGCNFDEVQGDYTTPTFLQTLVSESTIASELFALYVPPYLGKGEVSFGWIDESRYKGELVWLPLEPSNSRYILNITSASYGDAVVQPDTTAVYTDSGNIAFGMDITAYLAIQQSVPGATPSATGVLEGFMTFPANTSIANLEPITYTFSNGSASVDIVVPPENYLVPQGLYGSLNLTNDALYTWLIPGNLGQKFLENAYTVYDLPNQRIGIAALA